MTPWPPPIDVRVRMGINTGEAIERDGDYFGPAVIRAARLMSLIDGRRVVCSTATADLVQVHLDHDIQLLPVGTVQTDRTAPHVGASDRLVVRHPGARRTNGSAPIVGVRWRIHA